MNGFFRQEAFILMNENKFTTLLSSLDGKERAPIPHLPKYTETYLQIGKREIDAVTDSNVKAISDVLDTTDAATLKPRMVQRQLPLGIRPTLMESEATSPVEAVRLVTKSVVDLL